MAKSRKRKSKPRKLKPYEIAEGVINLEAYLDYKEQEVAKTLVFDDVGPDEASFLVSHIILDPSNDGSADSILFTFDDWDLEDDPTDGQ